MGWGGVNFLLVFWAARDISWTFGILDPLKLPETPHGVGWVHQICLGSNDSRINLHMRAKFGCSETVVWKKGGQVAVTAYKLFLAVSILTRTFSQSGLPDNVVDCQTTASGFLARMPAVQIVCNLSLLTLTIGFQPEHEGKNTQQQQEQQQQQPPAKRGQKVGLHFSNSKCSNFTSLTGLSHDYEFCMNTLSNMRSWLNSGELFD